MTLRTLTPIGAVCALVLAAAIQTGSAAQTIPTAPVIAAAAPAASAETAPIAGDAASASDTGEASPQDIDPALAAQVECVAKVILHEAGNQPEAGQVAVAQVIRTRIKAGRFGADACAVIGQRGQFFNVAAYRPARGAAWANAVAIAARTLAGEGQELVEGAVFFHSVGSPMPGRIRVAQIADHVFYR